MTGRFLSSAARLGRTAEVAARVSRWRGQGERVVLAVGQFDVLRAPHARFVGAARRRGARLVIAVTGDAPRAAAGLDAALLPEDERARLAAAMRGVDAVVVRGEPGFGAIVRRLKPDLLVWCRWDALPDENPERETDLGVAEESLDADTPAPFDLRERARRLEGGGA